jgi:hypothetical protein
MALQQVSLSGVIICPVLELGQRLGVNSFTHQHRDGHHNRCGSEKSRSPFFPLRKRPGKFHSGARKSLKVVLTDHCFVTCDDGNGNIVFTKEIEYTDFPLDEITLYFANNVIHLPSEY